MLLGSTMVKFNRKIRVRIDGKTIYAVVFYLAKRELGQSSLESAASKLERYPTDKQIYSVMAVVDGEIIPVLYQYVRAGKVELLPDDFQHPDLERIIKHEEARQDEWDKEHEREVFWDKSIGFYARSAFAPALIKTVFRNYLDSVLTIDQALGMVVDYFHTNEQGLVWRAKSLSTGEYAQEGNMVYGYLNVLGPSPEAHRYGPPKYYIGFLGRYGEKREYEVDPTTLEIMRGKDTPEYRNFKEKLKELELIPFLDSLDLPIEM